MLLDAAGKSVSERLRIVTPAVPTPEAVLTALDEFRTPFPDFDRVSVGFPGIVKRGVTYPRQPPSRLGQLPSPGQLAKRWSKPVRVGNDADIAGYGAIQGQGVELVLTLGTGLGSALFTNGHLVPGLELGHHPWRKKGMNYEDYLGRRGLDKYGKARWNTSSKPPSIRPSCSSTGTTSTWAAATPKKSTSPCQKTSPSPMRKESWAGVYLWRDQG